MRTTLPGSVGFAYLSDRVVESYLSDMTPASGPLRHVRPPSPLRAAIETAVLYVVFLIHPYATLSIADNSLIEDDFYPGLGAHHERFAS